MQGGDARAASDVKRHERAWQDDQGGALQERAYERPGTQVVLHRQFERVQRALALQDGMRLLDVGCGTGHFLAWISSRLSADWHGADLSVNSVRKAKSGCADLRLIAADAEQLPYRDGQFDRICCNGSAHHLLDLRSALAEFHRVMRARGRLVMYEPTATAFTNGVRKLFAQDDQFESPADLAHKFEFTSRSVCAELRSAGFSEIRVSSHDWLAYPLTGMYQALPPARSRTTMERFVRLENLLERWPVTGPVGRLFAWRWLIVATKES